MEDPRVVGDGRSVRIVRMAQKWPSIEGTVEE
jgi:hypothetical protein